MNEIIKCDCCGKKIKRPVKEINRIKKRGHHAYCSDECEKKHKYDSTRREVSCFNCEKKFLIKKSHMKRSNNGKYFCCQSCAAQHNNKGMKKSEETRRRISAKMKEHYLKNKDSLFWIQSDEKTSDWFVVSDSEENAIEYHNYWEDKKFNKDDLKAIYIKRLRKNYRDDSNKDNKSFYATDDVLSRIGLDVVSKRPVEVKYKGYTYKERCGRIKEKENKEHE